MSPSERESFYDQEYQSFSDYLKIAKRHKNKMAITFVLIFGICAIIAYGLPGIYESRGTILIEQQEIPTDLVRSTVTSYADQRIQAISQRVMTRANLVQLIKKYNLYEDELRRDSLDSVVVNMRDEIGLEMVSADVIDPRRGVPTQATIAFTLTYENRSPEMAQKVANELVSLFLDENLNQRTQVAAEASNFLTIESNKLNSQILDLEDRLAEFKQQNATSLPELSNLNLQLMERTERQLSDVDQQVRSLTERQIYLESELAQISPYSLSYSATGQRVLGASDRLKALQSEYVSLVSRYSEEHPDVVKMQREIEALEEEVGIVDSVETQAQLKKQRAELAALKKRYSAEHPDIKNTERSVARLEAMLAQASEREKTSVVTDGKPDNPAYIQLKSQLEATTSQLDSLRKTRAEAEQKLVEYEARITAAPQVEREYKELVRDYDNAQLKYREVKNKEMEASMSEAMEQARKGERFTLLEPPLLPQEPSKPNRIAIVFLGFVFAIGGAVGVAAIAAALDDSIRDIRSLISVTHQPPLAVIPYIDTAAEVQAESSKKILYVCAAMAVVIGAVLAVHFLFYPLDIAFFVLQRKLGM